MKTLVAEKRDIFGKKLKCSRALGKMPVVAYGPGKENMNLFVIEKDFIKLYREAGESTMIGVETTDGRFEVIIQEVTMHPVTGNPLHADFYLIERGKKMEVAIPLEFIGNAGAVKSLGGILVKVMHEVNVEVLPGNIPPYIEVDISKLATLEDVITIDDLVIPEGTDVLAESTEVVALIAVQEVDEVEDITEIDFSAIEAEKKGKKEEVESLE